MRITAKQYDVLFHVANRRMDLHDWIADHRLSQSVRALQDRGLVESCGIGVRLTTEGEWFVAGAKAGRKYGREWTLLEVDQ